MTNEIREARVRALIEKTKDDIKAARKKIKITEAIFNVGFYLLLLFMLFFLVSRVFFGGFYGNGSRVFATVSFIVSCCSLLFCGVLFFVKRVHYRTIRIIIRCLLCVMALVIAAAYFAFGANGYLIVWIALPVLTFLYTVGPYLSLFTGEKGRIGSTIATGLCVLAVALGTVVSCGGMQGAADGVYLETGAFKRSVRYEVGLDGDVELDAFMLTASDLFGIKTQDKYTVLSEVQLEGYEEPSVVSGISSYAFQGVRSVREIELPATITEIDGIAFEDSKLETLTVNSSAFTVRGDFANAAITQLRIAEGAEVVFTNAAQFNENIKILVAKSQIDHYRQKYPEMQGQIEPVLAENEIFVNYNITAPDDSGVLTEYIQTQIVTKNADGIAEVALPFSGMEDTNEYFGEHWVHTAEGKVYRLPAMTVNGEKIVPTQGKITTSESLNIYGEWQEIPTVRADYTSIGGEVELLTELYPQMNRYALPENLENPLKTGYVCEYWCTDAERTDLIFSITDLSKSYVLYPEWGLKKPTVEVSGYHATYDGQTHEIVAAATHEAPNVTFSYSWYKGEDYVSGQQNTLSVKDVVDSGTYTLTVRARDDEGDISWTDTSVTVQIDRAPLTVEADNQSITYGDENVALTYTHTALIGQDSLSGELIREAGDNAGVYAIGQGTLTAGGNYDIFYTAASYTIAPKPISIVAESKTITYGDEKVALTYKPVTGLVNGDALEGALTREAVDNAGVYAIKQGTLTAGSNYTISFTGATYTIQKAQYDMSTVVYDNATFEYDGQPHTARIKTVLPIGKDGVGLTVTYAGAATNVDDGTVTTTATFATTSVNYEIPSPMTATTAITPKVITVTADNKSITYGESDVPLTYTNSALVGDDVLVGELTRESGDDAGTYDILIGSLGSVGTNYTISFTGATYTIKKATATIDVSGVETSYVYTGALQTIDSGATLNHNETTLKYSNNTFTTVSEGNVLQVVISAAETTNYKAASEIVTITVAKATVAVPEAKTGLVYTGDELTGVEANDLYTVSNGSATNANDYTATVTLKDADNYQWSDEAFDGQIAWKIEKATVAVPTQGQSFEYTGSTIVGVTDTQYYTVLEGGSATEIDEYTARVELNDAQNYRWEDDLFNGEVQWSIVEPVSPDDEV